MKQKKYITDEEIDLTNLINIIWKNKILIISITLFFTILGNFYKNSKPSIIEYKSQIVIKEPPKELFIDLVRLDGDNNEDLKKDLNRKFLLNLNSIDNLNRFVNLNKDIQDFKNFLKLKKINAKQYFTNRTEFQQAILETSIENEVVEYVEFPSSKYTLFFDKSLKGDIFLNEYVEFTQEITSKEFFLNQQKILKNKIDRLFLNLKIAESIELDNPLIKTRGFNESPYVITQPGSDYFKGKKVLTLEIQNLQKIYKNLNDKSFDFNPIIDTAHKPLAVRNNKYKYYPYFAFLLGLFISTIFVLYRHTQKN